ncbi:uncharacterized protein LOC112689803 isoform X2 [Sipha flava]|uniref:Uncharacterized protein LOC112689803 isoform X2 n=1 Tax=Sipha flava TaxID=143950 RepID=A0A8B8GA04_9HEMI|nr:uncharacterized protein LOC112689803 isoform X2 [Sipha flava]
MTEPGDHRLPPSSDHVAITRGHSGRCNEARRMSEGGLVMPSCLAANFNNNNTTNNNNRSQQTGVLRRKFSFPAVLQSQGLHAELGGIDFGGSGGSGGGGGPSMAVATARRRFSNVSDVVSRKLSHTIGWRTAVPTEQIARQGRALCVQYVRWKLKRAGAYTKKCAAALRCARATAIASTATADVAGGFFIPPLQVGGSAATGTANDRAADGLRREVFPAMLRVGLQLERLDPKLYATGMTANDTPMSTAAAAALSHRLMQRPAFRRNAADTATAAVVLVSVSRELFRAGAQVTWAKVVSLVCVAAGLAVECSRRGRAEQLPGLIEAVGEVIEDDLAAWIHYNGGWMGLQSYCKPIVVNVENPISTQIVYLVSCLVVIIFFLLMLRWFDFISMFR